MNELNRASMYRRKIAEVDSAGHNRNFKSLDETGTKASKGITKDITSPNLGEYDRSQRFEGQARPPLGFDGSSDNIDKAHSDLEVPIGQGLEAALGDPSKAPEASTKIQDIGPDTDPRSDPNVNPFSKLYSPPATPRKRDRIKNLFKKKP